MELTGIDHVVLCVADIGRSIDWYRELFGVGVERLAMFEAGTSPFVSLRVTDTFIVDLVPSAPDGRNVDHLALTAGRDDFDRFVAEHADLIEMGPAQLSGAQGIGDGIYLRDPDGHRIELRTYG